MKIHFLGVAGSGASAAAEIARSQGYVVSGCDKELNGHSPNHLKNIDILAVTPAIFSLDPQNPELLEAKKLGIPIMTWQEFMGKYLQRQKFVIAISGTHGKTTTTAMIGTLLEDAGLDPTVELGAEVFKWKANFRIGQGKYFVCEADEYNDNFLNFKPDIAVVTNIEMDHPEYFKDFVAVKKSFEKFKKKSKKVFDKPNPKLINFSLQIPGDFNILNASLAFQVGLLLRINPLKIKQSLSSYSSVGRRFEYLGDFQKAKIYSDFGHHPTEIKVTMEAARQKFPKQKIWLIYEPHMFTRTKAFFKNFVKVFREIPVDKIIITDIYQSREIDKGLVNSKQLVEAVNKENTFYISKKELKNYLEKVVSENDVVFFMGAGDIDKLARNFVNLPD